MPLCPNKSEQVLQMWRLAGTERVIVFSCVSVDIAACVWGWIGHQSVSVHAQCPAINDRLHWWLLPRQRLGFSLGQSVVLLWWIGDVAFGLGHRIGTLRSCLWSIRQWTPHWSSFYKLPLLDVLSRCQSDCHYHGLELAGDRSCSATIHRRRCAQVWRRTQSSSLPCRRHLCLCSFSMQV